MVTYLIYDKNLKEIARHTCTPLKIKTTQEPAAPLLINTL